jgi:hypothetical protein
MLNERQENPSRNNHDMLSMTRDCALCIVAFDKEKRRRVHDEQQRTFVIHTFVLLETLGPPRTNSAISLIRTLSYTRL